MRLANKIALVTGAASGIGKACAERMAMEGATVLVTDLKRDSVANTVAQIRSAGGQAEGCVLDVTRETDWAAAMDKARDMGGLDILVNNAGFGQYESVETETLEGWRAVTACILDGPFLGMKAAIPLLKSLYVPVGYQIGIAL